MTKKAAPIAAPEVPETAAAPKRSRKRAAAPVQEAAVEVAATEPEVVAAAPEAPAEAKPGKQKKTRLVRDSYTMPESEHQLIAAIKKRCLDAGVAAKKSEVLRAAVTGLAKLGDAELVAAIQSLEAIKTGRPAK